MEEKINAERKKLSLSSGKLTLKILLIRTNRLVALLPIQEIAGELYKLKLNEQKDCLTDQV